VTPVGQKQSGERVRARRDLRTAGAAILLLALCGGIWLWMSATASEHREKVLATVPAFPVRGQDQQSRRARPAAAPQERAPDRAPPPAPEPAQPARTDPITSFVLKPAPYVALVHVNALLNTPLFARIKECVPVGWRQVTESMEQLGIDVERDVDRVAMMADGMALSGFFEGKPIARNIASQWSEVEERSYRGQTLWMSRSRAVAQVGNLLVLGPRDSIEPLLDRALDPAPAAADPQDVYGDVFVRTDLTALLGSESRRDDATAPDPMSAVLQALSSVVVRANVWDLVALSVEGKPQSGKDVRDLASMARGALAVAKEQLDPGDVDLATLASLAKVDASKDALLIDLALPGSELFDKLHFPCPGAEPQAPGASAVAP